MLFRWWIELAHLPLRERVVVEPEILQRPVMQQRLRQDPHVLGAKVVVVQP